MRSTSFVVAVALLSAPGCASIVSKSDWPVTVSSAQPGVPFTIKKDSGVAVARGETPCTLTLSASDGYFDGAAYVVEAPGGTVPLNSRLNGWSVGNVVFGGLIGLLIVDPATGSMWKLPEIVTVSGAAN